MKTTKFIFSLLCLSFFFTLNANDSHTLPTNESTNVNGIPITSGFILIADKDLAFKMNRSEYESLFDNIFYNSESHELCFIAKKNINFVQILTKDGELQFQLPVLSKKLHLDIDDLDLGNYQINLISTGPYTMVEGELTKRL